MISKIKIPVSLPDVLFYTDIVYANRMNEWKQAVYPMKLHLMRPFTDMEGADRHPLIVWIGGGAWKASTPFRHIPCLSYFARNGYVVASIDYRVSGMDYFPAQIQDVKAAVRYLRLHAAEYGIDPEKIAVMGDSAGGHLSALAGTSGDRETFGTPDYPEVSCEVQAVVDLYGPSDFLQMPGADEPEKGFLWQMPESLLLGGHVAGMRELAQKASPITYINENTPPFLLLHGTDDSVVSVKQSEILYEALVNGGVEADLYELEGANHATPHFVQPEVQKLILEFLDRRLKG